METTGFDPNDYAAVEARAKVHRAALAVANAEEASRMSWRDLQAADRRQLYEPIDETRSYDEQPMQRLLDVVLVVFSIAAILVSIAGLAGWVDIPKLIETLRSAP